MGTGTANVGGRRWRRWVQRAVAIVLLGCAASVISAWVLALVYAWNGLGTAAVPMEFGSKPPGATSEIGLLRWTDFGRETWSIPAFWPSRSAEMIAMFPEWKPAESSAWPHQLPSPPADPAEGVRSEGWGWPWISMNWVVTWQEGLHGAVAATKTRGAWVVQIHQKGVTFPLVPIWRGFFGNAAVFGMLIGVVWWGPGILRRTIRRRRGRCVKCGYSLRGSSGVTCPECGSRVGQGATG